MRKIYIYNIIGKTVAYLFRLFKHRDKWRRGYWHLKYSWIVVANSRLKVSFPVLNPHLSYVSLIDSTAWSKDFSMSILLKNRSKRKTEWIKKKRGGSKYKNVLLSWSSNSWDKLPKDKQTFLKTLISGIWNFNFGYNLLMIKFHLLNCDLAFISGLLAWRPWIDKQYLSHQGIEELHNRRWMVFRTYISWATVGLYLMTLFRIFSE